MAELPIFSSQGSQYEQHQLLTDQENIGSSPLGISNEHASTSSSQKMKKPPTVTPKRFKKFFTPRETLTSRAGRRSKASRQLRDITRNGANRRRTVRHLQCPSLDVPNEDAVCNRPLKRRKHSIDIASSPPQSSPLKHVMNASEIKVFEDAPTSPTISDEDALTDLFDDMSAFPQPIRRLRQSDRSGRILRRSFGGYDALTHGWRGYDHCTDWRAETSNFVSTPADIHAFTGTALPFCTASCNTNSLVAVGEEQGGMRIIDSSPSSDFTTAHVTFRPHNNALMDMAFSSDDYMLATASGDQTARIIDMHTQHTVCILSGHKSSVKQVRFQPNDDNMITTSSRDGSVQLWDMRCGSKGSIASLHSTFARNVDNGEKEPAVRYSKYTMDAGLAHRYSTRANGPVPSSGICENASITSIQHLPNGLEHLLVTTSEVNSSIKLWDLRNAGRRGGFSTPLSSTPVPWSHTRTRNYGINATVLSTDGARMYAVCRDGTVYAYSTNHLVLGSAPEMSSLSSRSRILKSPKTGIGPLYGFRHQALRIGSFYVKASLRPAKNDKSEMLAVGSSDGCAVLFPTDERHLPQRERPNQTEEEEDSELPTLPTLSEPRAQPSGFPIYEHGAALVRGHDKEVTALTWTHNGELVTICDDFSARCWREDANAARELRGCGEAGGKRWRSGWADVDVAWDEAEG